MPEPIEPSPQSRERRANQLGILPGVVGFVLGVAITTPLVLYAGFLLIFVPRNGWKAVAFFLIATGALAAIVLQLRRIKSSDSHAELFTAILVGAAFVLLLSETCAGCLVAGRGA